MLGSSVTKNIQRLVERYQKASKLPTNKGGNDTFNSEIATVDSLLNVTPYKFYDVDIDRKDCRCPIKTPLYEWEFYVDEKKRE